MGDFSSSKELFPGSNNIQITSFATENIASEVANVEGNITEDETIPLNDVRNIIQDQHWYNLKDYQEATMGDRFYISDLFAKRKKDMMSIMTKHDTLHRTYTNYSNDFEMYNKRVRREYELREKIEGLLRQQQSGDVKVLSESSIYNNFLAGEDFGPNKFNKHWNPKSFFPSFLGFLTWKRSITDRCQPNSAFSQSRSSTSTYVIDNTSYGQMAINESMHPVNNSVTRDDSMISNSSRNTRSYEQVSSFLTKTKRVFNNPNYADHHLQRKLKTRHMQMLGVGACFSVGIFLTSGKAFSIAGPFGTLLGFSLTGSVVLATLLSFTELSTLIPVSSGFSGLASRFVEDAFGFALGWTYWFSCMIALPAQILASTFYLSYYPNLSLSSGETAGFVLFFLMFNVIVNLADVRLLGEVVYIIGITKLFITIAMIIAMLILNAGHGGVVHEQVGFRYWDSSKSVGELTYGLFRPTFDLLDDGSGSTQGIAGPTGRFLAISSVMLISTFAYSGVEMPFLASGEAINPRATIPSAIKRVFCIVLTLYIFIILSVGINFYSGDPRLLSYYNGTSEERFISVISGIGTDWQLNDHCQTGLYSNRTNTSHSYSSPWVLALQNFGLCTFAATFNGILIFFTTSAGISSLFSSSRTLYAMSVQGKAPFIFQKCSKGGIPFVSVLFSGFFGLLSCLALDKTAMENFDVLSNISSASTSIIWMGLNLSFLRFFYALKKRKDIISRDDKTYPYRSPFQPFLAIYGMVGCILFILFMGYPNFMHTYWNTKSFFSAYGGLMLFSICYIGYKVLGTSKIQRLDQLNMDTGRREMDRMFWTENLQYSGPYRERLKSLVNWLY